jgi:hypothetical protein
MSKKPKIDHEYHAGKDKMKITIHGYALSKEARNAIMKKVMAEVERKPDRLIATAKKKSHKKKSKKGAGEKLPSAKRDARFIQVGD